MPQGTHTVWSALPLVPRMEGLSAARGGRTWDVLRLPGSLSACQGRGRGCPAGREAGAATFIYLRLQNGCENSMLTQEAQRRLEKCNEFFFKTVLG